MAPESLLTLNVSGRCSGPTAAVGINLEPGEEVPPGLPKACGSGTSGEGYFHICPFRGPSGLGSEGTRTILGRWPVGQGWSTSWISAMVTACPWPLPWVPWLRSAPSFVM